MRVKSLNKNMGSEDSEGSQAEAKGRVSKGSVRTKIKVIVRHNPDI